MTKVGACILAWLCLSSGIVFSEDTSCRACDREMRKTIEGIQAWRRQHNGQYPFRLVDLKESGLLNHTDAICPDLLMERTGADPAHSEISSRRPGGDTPEMYEYELSDKVDKWEGDKLYLPDEAKKYTRQDLKAVLLRRKFYEQVAILRCSSHRNEAPPELADRKTARRNATLVGEIYWSGIYWEQMWLNDVPYCARDANVMFGSKGPPFHSNVAPALTNALDLRKWSCAFGDHAWWWTCPMFEENANRQNAAHLQPFFQENHGHIASVAEQQWWLDGLVQLQGRVLTGRQNRYKGPGLQAFVFAKTNVVVERKFVRASWLQGTAWPALLGETTGWLVWRYSDGSTERVPLIYGKTTGRFWGDLKQIEGEKGFTEPVWKHHETAEAVGKERWLRLYQQTWINPRPDVMVVNLDFVSNRDCPASPFLIAVNVTP